MNQKKQILFITPYPLGEAASQRFRFEQYLKFLNEESMEWELRSFLDLETWRILYKKGNIIKKAGGILKGFFNRLLLMFKIWKYDYIFIHREATPIGPPIFEWITAKVYKKKIIYDFDDAIWLPNTSGNNQLAAGLKWHEKVVSICKWSYKVSCGNQFLAEFAKKYNKNVIINPTTIDTLNLHNPDLFLQSSGDIFDKNDPVVIGWTGSHSTLLYLKIIVPALQQLEQKHDFIFKVISNHPPELLLKNLIFVPWNKTTEIEDLKTFDIGVMPLENDVWAEGKCGFKSLQYMAMGIPSVVSPVGVNNEIIDHGEDGYFCNTIEDWIHHLELLIRSSSLRNKIGAKGREKVVKNYSVNSNKMNFLNLFQ